MKSYIFALDQYIDYHLMSVYYHYIIIFSRYFHGPSWTWS